MINTNIPNQENYLNQIFDCESQFEMMASEMARINAEQLFATHLAKAFDLLDAGNPKKPFTVN
jgi:hypothetical protein